MRVIKRGKKIYFNHYHDKALIVNDSDKTFRVLKASDLNNKQVAFYYNVTLARMREVAKIVTAQGYTRG